MRAPGSPTRRSDSQGGYQPAPATCRTVAAVRARAARSASVKYGDSRHAATANSRSTVYRIVGVEVVADPESIAGLDIDLAALEA